MQTPKPQIENKLHLLPDKPGVYLWKNAKGEVIYVGKALSLKNRVRSYLNNSPKDPKTEQLVIHIAALDYIITTSEAEAFLLEASLIKQNQPKYNVLLKDDKRYPYVKITINEPFPRVFVTREIIKDGSRYFGPYTDVRSLRRTLRSFEWLFPIRNCTRNIPIGAVVYKKACINYQLGKCSAPCIGKISQGQYMQIVNKLIGFFEGKYEELLREFRHEMNSLSEELRFEEAAKIRDRIIAIQNIQKRQSVVYTDCRNVDIIGFYQEENDAVCLVLKMQEGAIVNQENYPMKNLALESRESILGSFIKLYYSQKDNLPQEILLPFEPQDYVGLSKWLNGKLTLPQRGEKTKLLAMAKRNAFNIVEERKLSHLRKANRTIYPIQELKEALGFDKLPRKIVCMDISTIQGTDTVSSAVYFENGKSKKKYYRHFIIRDIQTQNDFAALQETLARFLKEIDKEPDMKPDLFIIDGGKGQLSATYDILVNSLYADIYIVSLAKRAEEIFLPGKLESVILSRSSSALRLVTRVRDEAHRFAISFHRSRRSKRTLISELEEISGIGEQSKFILLKELGSVENIRLADIETLTSIKGIGAKTAKHIYDFFHKEQS
ncbi:MAG: excinuclease ABC subunit UvrC [Candidatus Cloacimonadaceae bacterium]|jgi:excinuclease ABC subunit C|nr:excinuclease ABC subunit UvrC [Candidatus Cloacimonadota bacterium]MDD4686764.1 excinuclease ABC subunit UvrC [Candidatus Cloacimonadota bacterium]MDY0299822.1 excinuclease ABC subunit UvrC [Candidatus Cloacimonadaceae bacterium]